jgi:hypothetical protein
MKLETSGGGDQLPPKVAMDDLFKLLDPLYRPGVTP